MWAVRARGGVGAQGRAFKYSLNTSGNASQVWVVARAGGVVWAVWVVRAGLGVRCGHAC